MAVMGRVIGPFGVQGWLKVNPYTEFVDGLLDYTPWWLSQNSDQWRKVQVEDGRISNNLLIVKLKEITDRTQASQLKGMLIAIPRKQLPNLAEDGTDGYYWSDLIDCGVVNLKGITLGTITGLIETGSNDVLRVQNTDKETTETLIPFIEQFVIKVDLQKKQVVVDWELDY